MTKMANDYLTKLENKSIVILGFGREGQSSYKFLRTHFPNKHLAIADIKEIGQWDKQMFDILKSDSRVDFHFGSDYLKSLVDYDFVIKSPGIRLSDNVSKVLQKKRIKISSQTQIFFEIYQGNTIGITGTKGKGTTSTLIYEIIKENNLHVCLAGNIGDPVLDIFNGLRKDSWVVLELSSFQLMNLKKSPHVSVVLNITEDHMDWHKDKDEYVNAKKNIVKYQNEDDIAIINADFKSSERFSSYTRAKTYFFSKNKRVRGAYVENGRVIVEIEEPIKIIDVKDLLLRGKHNWENVCAAVCTTYLMGTSKTSIKKVLKNFIGLAHRLEPVDTVKKVSFYNDSFSTNPQTTTAAIKSFSEPLTLILGGYDKGLSYDGMAKEIVKESVENVILIGDIADKIKKSLEKAEYAGGVFEMGKEDIKKIVAKAFKITPRAGVVLLSPATSSFDMFRNYKERGNLFKEAVRELKDN
jgi:UDP-N-acetylmuramoylalanine--D-glutamate ligase